jgi:Sulfotransferase family
MRHPYPHFLIVGFMKCATTTLFEQLMTHPRIQPPIKKELHYFTREWDPFYDLDLFGMEYFEQLQFDGSSGKLCGEASPSYILAANRIAAFNANAKIIILVRDPVERAMSQYRHYRQYGIVKDETLALDDHSIGAMNIVQDSCYALRIADFIQHFSTRNILLVSFEEFCRSQRETMRHVIEFLDLEPIAIEKEVKLSSTELSVEPDGLREAVSAYFAERRGEVAQLVRRHGLRIVPDRIQTFEQY